MTKTSNAEHLFISDLRRHPSEEVRLLVGGRLVSGTRPGGVIASIEEMIREAKEAAWLEGFGDGKRQDAEGDDGPRFVNPYEVKA